MVTCSANSSTLRLWHVSRGIKLASYALNSSGDIAGLMLSQTGLISALMQPPESSSSQDLQLNCYDAPEEVARALLGIAAVEDSMRDSMRGAEESIGVGINAGAMDTVKGEVAKKAG